MRRLLRARLVRFALVGGLGLLGAFLLSACTAPTTFRVNSTADKVDANPGDGVCQTSTAGECTLRAAVQEANALAGAQTIVLQQGATYTLSLGPAGDDVAASGDLDISGDLTIQGSKATIDGANTFRVFNVIGTPTVSLEDLTIANGWAGGAGGGIWAPGGGQLTVSRSTLTGNHANGNGGAISMGNPTHTSGTLSVDRSLFVGNSSDAAGGAIATFVASGSVTSSTLSGNSVAASGEGAAIRTFPGLGLVVLQDSTVTNNDVPAGTGALQASSGTLGVHNSIVADQATGANCAPYVHGDFNIDSDGSCSSFQNSQVGDPGLGPLVDAGGPTLVHLPDPAGIAVDVAGDTACTKHDQRGYARPQDADGSGTAECDVGAVELAGSGPPTFVVETGSDGVDANIGDGLCADARSLCTLRAAVQEANAAGGATIDLDGRPATLTLAGASENAAATGDLDITSAVTIENGTIQQFGTSERLLDVQSSGSLHLADVVVCNGDAPGDGGGLRVLGSATLERTAVVNNQAGGQGGGLYVGPGASADLDSSFVAKNSADRGGNIATIGHVTVVNSTVVEGQAATSGGGIDSSGSTQLTFVTLTDNSAPDGAGIRRVSGITTLSAAIVGPNGGSGSDCSGTITSAGYNLDSDGTCLASPATGDRPGVDPVLTPLADNGGPFFTRKPRLISPAIDMIPSGTAPCDGSIATDQRGVTRPARGACDAGVTEGPAMPIVAGTGAQGYSGDGGPATEAEFNRVTGIAVDKVTGDFYIVDLYNNAVRKVDGATGIITTVAGGNGRGYSGDGGLATAAQLYYPSGIALDAAGNLYVVDFENFAVRRVDATTGIITTVAGGNGDGHSGDGGQATDAQLDYPGGIAFDSAGDIYISEQYAVRRIDAGTGVITTYAGGNGSGWTGDGGQATAATLTPGGLALDSAGNLYIGTHVCPTAPCDDGVRRVDAATGVITTVAGGNGSGYSGDGGQATDAQLSDVRGVLVDDGGNLIIAQGKGVYGNPYLRQVDTSGVITTIAGSGSSVTGADGDPLAIGITPQGLAIDAFGQIYFTELDANEVRRLG